MEKLHFTDRPLYVAVDIDRLCTDLQTVPVFICRKSEHPDDAHLFLVLAERRYSPSETSYTVWVYNSSTNTLQCGAYALTFSTALKNMSERLWNISTE